jgi:mono/diheme cytochrome c family protein
MKRTIKSISVIILTVAFALMSVSASGQPQKKGEPWTIPAEYKKMANPVNADEVSVNAGQIAYAKNCASCHGKTGLGDGPKGRMCKTFPGDFSSAEFQQYTDGEMFYQTKFGRGEMPAYDKKIPDNEIWNMINYIRSLKKSAE